VAILYGDQGREVHAIQYVRLECQLVDVATTQSTTVRLRFPTHKQLPKRRTVFLIMRAAMGITAAHVVFIRHCIQLNVNGCKGRLSR
jgi:hypothetical protein